MWSSASLATPALCLLLASTPTTMALRFGGAPRTAVRPHHWQMMASDAEDPFASISECLVESDGAARLDCLEGRAAESSESSEAIFASIRECVVGAENAAEQEACLVDDQDAVAASSAAPALPHDPTENLLGPHESLAECIWEAENPGEIVECRVDFEELLGVRGHDPFSHHRPRNASVRPTRLSPSQVPTGECDAETEICNPEDIRTQEQIEQAASRTSTATMSMCGLVGPDARFGPGKCIFRGDKCTGKRCKVNNAPCKVNHSS
jgi:hypothetical protein